MTSGRRRGYPVRGEFHCWNDTHPAKPNGAELPKKHDPVITHIIRHCGDLKAGEKVAVIGDPRTAEITRRFASICRDLGGLVTMALLAEVAPCHGAEPDAAAAEAMRSSDLIFGLTWFSMAHTKARLSAAQNGGRYLSLPQYTEQMLEHPALMVDYRSLTPPQIKIAQALTAGKSLRFTTSSGSDVSLDITGRDANFCPGFLDDRCRLASPPDMEVNVSPIEEATEGLFVVDGSVALDDIACLDKPIYMKLEKGACTAIYGDDSRMVAKIENIFREAGNGAARIVGEFGLGFNPAAQPCGNMLLDEGSFGCVHLGFGSNSTMGGKNSIAFHLDFIARSVTVEIDGRLYMRDGQCL